MVRCSCWLSFGSIESDSEIIEHFYTNDEKKKNFDTFLRYAYYINFTKILVRDQTRSHI